MATLNVTNTVDDQATVTRWGGSFTVTTTDLTEREDRVVVLTSGELEIEFPAAIEKPKVLYLANEGRQDGAAATAGDFIKVGYATGDYVHEIAPGTKWTFPLRTSTALGSIFVLANDAVGADEQILRYRVWGNQS